MSGCSGGSTTLLFASDKIRFSHVGPNIIKQTNVIQEQSFTYTTAYSFPEYVHFDSCPGGIQGLDKWAPSPSSEIYQ